MLDPSRISWHAFALSEAVPTIPPDLVGPAAGLVLALIGLYLFLTERVVPGSRLVKAEAAVLEALRVTEAAVASQRQMATALEERNKLDQERLRLIQGGVLDEFGRVVWKKP